MINTPPLGLFLTSLATDGIHVTLRDYDRISILLRTSGPWSLTRLRDTLLALLAKNEEQQEIFLHRFAEFFATDLEIDPLVAEVDIAQVLTDVQLVVPQERQVVPIPSAEVAPLLPANASKPIPLWQRWSVLIPAGLFLLLLVASLVMYLVRPTVTPVIEPPPAATLPATPPSVAPTLGQQRLYENVPIVTVKTEPRAIAPLEWLPHLLVALILATVAFGYFLIIQRSRRIPEDQPPPWPTEGPRYFPLGAIGGKPAPLFCEAELDELADSMGYFLSEEPSSELDVFSSVQMTMRHGGVPSLKFYRRHTVRSLLILEDAFAESIQWNPIATELAAGMDRRGIEVIQGRFFGSPDHFRLANGPIMRIEDIEDQRQGYVVLIFSDGRGIARHEDTFALETLGRWPMVAWMDLREPRSWDETAALPTFYSIPIFPATPLGAIQAIRRFLTEQGATVDYAKQIPLTQTVTPLETVQSSLFVEEFLGDAFPFAQICALFQPVSPGLADKLRRQFCPELPAQCIGRLYALPDTRQTVSGLRFSPEVLRVLRTAFFVRCDDREQEVVLGFLQAEIERMEPADQESVAHLAWEAVRERIRFELDQDMALERLSQLAKTPLGEAISDSFYGFGFRDEQIERIPLRLKPNNQNAWQRLARITENFNISRLEKYPVSIPQWTILGTLIAVCMIVMGMGIWRFLVPPDLSKNWTLVGNGVDSVYGLLKQQNGEVWVPALPKEAGGPFRKWPAHLPLQSNQQYQLAVYEVGHQDTYSFTLPSYSYANVEVQFEDRSYNCREDDPAIGLTVYRCPQPKPGILHNPVVEHLLWRNRWQAYISNQHMISIGIEFRDPRQDALAIHQLRNVLLDLAAVDLVFSIDAHGSIEQQTKAFTHIEQFLGPLTTNSQVLLWSAEQSLVSYRAKRQKMSRIFPNIGNLEHLRNTNRWELGVVSGNVWLPYDEIEQALAHEGEDLQEPISGTTPVYTLPPSLGSTAAITSDLTMVPDLTQEPPTATPDLRFDYPVLVVGTQEEAIADARVLIEIAGQSPLGGFTDSAGYVRFSVPASYAGKPGRLLIEADGYGAFRQEIDLYVEQLPQLVRLEAGLTTTAEANLTVRTEGTSPNIWILDGDGVNLFNPGDSLVIYGVLLQGTETVIAQVQVITQNPNSLVVQVVLRDPGQEVRPGLRADANLAMLEENMLVPAADFADGYVLADKRIRLRPGHDLAVGTVFQAFEAQKIGQRISDYLPFSPPLLMKIIAIGVTGEVASAELISGEWPALGTLISNTELDPLLTATSTPVLEPVTSTPSATSALVVLPTVTPVSAACQLGVDPELAVYWVQAEMGCPLSASAITWASYTPYQTGLMLWRRDTNMAYGFFNSGSWLAVTEVWDGSSPVPSRGVPPVGYKEPVRGTGYIWGTDDRFFNELGWAADDQKGFCAKVQSFEQGFILRSSTVSSCHEENLFNHATDEGFGLTYLMAHNSGYWQRSPRIEILDPNWSESRQGWQTVRWRYTGELKPGQGFDLMLWYVEEDRRRGITDARSIAAKLERHGSNEYSVLINFSTAAAVEQYCDAQYLLAVTVVELEPYRQIGPQSDGVQIQVAPLPGGACG